VPLHFLAEPESSTRTTAEASGSPTYRHYEQRQHFIQWMMGDLLQVVITRRSMLDPSINREAPLAIHPADISDRDNLTLSTAGVNVAGLFERLHEMGLVDEEEMLRVIYRFLGESGNIEDILERARRVPTNSARAPRIAHRQCDVHTSDVA